MPLYLVEPRSKSSLDDFGAWDLFTWPQGIQVLFCFKKLGRVRNFSQIGAGRKQDPKVSGMVGWALGHSEVRPLAP